MDNEKKTIRFIDSDYRTLFTIPDGDKITLTFSDGETVTRSCKYLDEYHTQVGSNVFHICEFAECMERNGTAYAPEKPLALPDMCFSTLPSTGELIRIERGSKGYTVLPYSTANTRENRKLADDLNQRRGVYPQQEAAMLAGGMFGWHTPAARIENYPCGVQERNRHEGCGHWGVPRLSHEPCVEQFWKGVFADAQRHNGAPCFPGQRSTRQHPAH